MVDVVGETVVRGADGDDRLQGGRLQGGDLQAVLLGVVAAGRPGAGDDDGADDVNVKSRDLWILAGLVAVGLLARATRLNESLWYDEIAAWTSYGVFGSGPIVGHYFDPSNHVAQTLASSFSVWLLETTIGPELALRLPALAASIATVPVIFALARRVLDRCGYKVQEVHRPEDDEDVADLVGQGLDALGRGRPRSAEAGGLGRR